MHGLEHLANGNNRASVISADGSVIGGFAQGSFSRTPAIWSADGTGQLLDPPNGDVVGEVQGISDDGTTLLGNWDGSAFYRYLGLKDADFGTNRWWGTGQPQGAGARVAASWALAAADYTLRVTAREDGVALDSLVLWTSAGAPRPSPSTANSERTRRRKGKV